MSESELKSAGLAPAEPAAGPISPIADEVDPSQSRSSTETLALGNKATKDTSKGPTPTNAGAAKATDASEDEPVHAPLDIEHLFVRDDPRSWSDNRKLVILLIVAFSSLLGSLATNIFFPALQSLQDDLKASDQLIAASVSLFILGQGVFPTVWSTIGELKGRKLCYIVSFAIFIAATVGCSRASTMPSFIVLRILQSLGSASVYSLGAGTLADIYDTHERGSKIGLYYAFPLWGTSLGPLIGGAIVSRGGWRATFYFVASYGALMLLAFVWLPETFRKERSLAWRLAASRARAHAKAKLAKAHASLPDSDANASNGKKTKFADPGPSRLERGEGASMPALKRALSRLSLRSGEDNVKVRFRDVNPFAATGQVFSRLNNVLAITYSGLLFGSQYCVTFTASRTFSAPPYSYNSIIIGLVLLSYGVGNIIGSVAGGRYSDRVLKRQKDENGGVSEPEMRVKSTIIAMPPLPIFFIVYAWVVQKLTPVYWAIIALFVLGLTTIWIYSSTLAYIVDANPGRSSSAVAGNSLIRGVFGCVASQIAEPLINVIGNGWFYTAWAFVLIAGSLAFLLVRVRGRKWRERAAEKEDAKNHASA